MIWLLLIERSFVDDETRDEALDWYELLVNDDANRYWTQLSLHMQHMREKHRKPQHHIQEKMV